MNFFSKVMFDDRMTPLEYDLFNKIRMVAGVTPDFYEVVLMVDADTKVMPTSLRLMINAMRNDPTIMGLCGETRIANKKASWVTAIQVYEYFISHHLAKNFESLFGGVTCLPGCFSMYRIKAPKGANGFWVPILANPDIVEEYSQNVVESKFFFTWNSDIHGDCSPSSEESVAVGRRSVPDHVDAKDVSKAKYDLYPASGVQDGCP